MEPDLDPYVRLVQHDGLLGLMEIHEVLVEGDGRQLDQPVRGYFRSVPLVLQCEGQALLWEGG